MIGVTRVHAFGDDALGDLDAVGLVAAIQEGEVSIPEVVDAAIARTERLQPDLNAVAYVAFDRARAEARDPRGGFFAGVPTFLKDNVDVAGMPTQQGCDAYRGRPLERDGDFARMFLATGLVPLGKTQLSEFGFSPSAEHPRLGPVRSPWDTAHTAGASSAGTAALVAAGAVPLAHGNDGGGSIRIPAAVNGLVGLKPTRDRLAQDEMNRQMPVRIVSDGVLTRSVRDTAAFLREAEHVYRALQLPPIGDVTRPGHKRLRVAVHTSGIGRAVVARGRRADAQDRPAARGARPRGRAGRPPRAGDASPTTSCSTGRCSRWRSSAPAGAARPRLGPEPPRQPHPRPGPALPPPAAPAARRDRPAAPARPGLRGVPPDATTSR